MPPASLTRLVLFAMSLAASAALSLPSPAQPSRVAITARAMVDVERGRSIEGATIVIQEGRIVAAGPTADVSVPAGTPSIQLPSTTLLPGLIDARVHLTLAGDPSANARATLAAGFITVQDLGAAAYGNVRLRHAIAAGRIEGPRVIASGPWLGIAGGTCDFNGIGVRGADAFRRRLRTDVERGVDLIKVCVTGWLTDAVREPSKYEIGDEEPAAAIDEAHQLGKRVAVHALSARGMAVSVRLEADLIAHAGLPEPETVKAMRARHVQQLPTLLSLSTAAPAEVLALLTSMRRAVADGLPVAFGTDAGVIPHGTNAREFEHFASIGLDAASALRAATLDAARAVGMAGEIGVLAPGRKADVIGVAGNPLEDIRTLQHVSFVIKDGRVFKDDSWAAGDIK